MHGAPRPGCDNLRMNWIVLGMLGLQVLLLVWLVWGRGGQGPAASAEQLAQAFESLRQDHRQDMHQLAREWREELQRGLSQAGAQVELLGFNGGHGIDPELLPAVATFVQRCLATAG